MQREKAIRHYKTDIYREYLSPLNNEVLKERVHHEHMRDRPDGIFQRDYSRIMYASSFRRLQGKMQLLGIRNDQFFRNRLTHSLEVAQIASSIADMIGYDRSEVYVVEAGALAHDIGNPPFGHSGERMLNGLFQDIGGFEGNAQTLRILTNLERKKPGFLGLNLTYRTLLSVVKYFNKSKEEGNGNQKFIYDDDYDLLYGYLSKNKIDVRTLDVQIVDIADEIAYAAHDLEDGLRQNCFTMDEVLHDYKVRYGESDSYQVLASIVEQSKRNAGFGDVKINSSQYSKIFRQELSSNIIYTLINDIGMCEVKEEWIMKTGTKQKEELSFLHFKELAEGLKEIIFECINHNNEVYSYEQKGNEILKALSSLYENNYKYLPPEYRAKDRIKHYNLDVDEDSLQRRLICDYISGMMDSYAISTYERFVKDGVIKDG